MSKDTNDLLDALQRLNRYIRRIKLQGLPLNKDIYHGQIQLLFLISQNDGIIQRDLADMLDMRAPSLTEKLSSLEKHSLIIRKQDEKDRRIMHVYLTEEGKAVIDGFVQVNHKLSSSIFNCLTPEEIEIMLKLANKINDNLEEMDCRE